MEQIRIIKEMRDRDIKAGRTGTDIRPRFMVWENVAGSFSSNGGRDFAAVLEETIRVVEPEAPNISPLDYDWTLSGCFVGKQWSVAWRVLDAQFWGVPQRRRRIALVADFGGQCAQEILFERCRSKGNSESCETQREGTSGDASDSFRTASGLFGKLGFGWWEPRGRDLNSDSSETAGTGFGETGFGYWQPGIQTLRAGHERKDYSNNVVVSDTVALEGNGSRESHQGDGYSETDTMYTLNTVEQHSVCYSIPAFNSGGMISDNPNTGYNPNDVARTLDTMGGDPTGYQGGIAVVQAAPDDCQDQGTTYGVTSKGNGDTFISAERHTSLSTGGGEAGQGYPCVLTPDDSGCLNPLDVQSKHIQPESDVGESYVMRSSGIQCLNPEDPQSERIYHPDGVYHSLNANSGGGLSRDGVIQPICLESDQMPAVCCASGFKGGQSDGGIGYQEETAPTLSASSSALEPTVVYSVCAEADQGAVYPDVARTLTARYDSSPCIDRGQEFVVYESHDQDARYTELGETCSTVSAKYGTGGGNAPMVVSCGNGQSNIASQVSEEVAGTLNCMHDQQIICAAVDCRNGTEDADTNGTFQAKPNSGTSLKYNNVVRQSYIVRRLTPLEAERLQGLPDGWTDIGEWVDSKGKKHRSADAPRYKAIGNGIAVPPWLWVLSRLNQYCGEDKTMASLFNGISTYPLIWSFLNGKENCSWDSEVDEFCNALTRIRFPDTDE